MSTNWPWAPRNRSNTNPTPDNWSHKKSPFQLNHRMDPNQHNDLLYGDDAPPLANPIPSWLLDDSDYKDLKPTPVMNNMAATTMQFPAFAPRVNHHQPSIYNYQEPLRPRNLPLPVPTRNFQPSHLGTQSISQELEEARRRLQQLQGLEAQSKENAPQTQSIYEPEVFTADAQWDAPIQHSSFSAPLSTPFWDRLAAASTEDTTTNNFRPRLNSVNYRVLLEKNLECDWFLIVERIVSENDQQASIFLQQKLKGGSEDIRESIIDSVTKLCIPLVTNRFGNFLVQRSIEYASSHKRALLVKQMVGHMSDLSVDIFGCHVVQKALDFTDDEELKRQLVDDLLESVSDTINHKYACHVWQRVFELDKGMRSPHFMQSVIESLRGRWLDISSSESGSLVIQTMVQNCTYEELALNDALDEISSAVKALAVSRWGSWVVRQLCSMNGPGGDAIRSLVYEELSHDLSTYGLDYSACRVLETIVQKDDGKDGNGALRKRYVEWLAKGSRPPLVSLARDSNGHVIVVALLQAGVKEPLETIIRKNYVTLRSSKFGTKICRMI
ncbi:YALIA101S04e14092g1_1 [Yarrowia lipolytica]|nr:YALIA101S04e14092g1_1 [Yarrowia lipolytica]